MKVYVKTDASKEDLMSVASGKSVRGIRAVPVFPENETGVSLVWSGVSRDAMPNWILVPDEPTRRDLLAWSTTYLTAHVPFTAFCHLVTPDEFALRNAPEFEPKLMQICAALVLSEASMLYSATPSARDCASTYSFVAARSVVLDATRRVFAEATRRYALMVALAADFNRADVVPLYAHVWDAVAFLRSGQTPEESSPLVPFYSAVRQLFDRGHLPTGKLREMAPAIERLELVDGLEKQTMEDRVLAFRRLTSGVRVEQGEASLAFVLGYILSRVSGGTLVHGPLLEALGSGSSFVLPWYAFCAGVHPGMQLDVSGDAAVGLRIVRELERTIDVSERPRCDLALPELEVLLKSHEMRADGALRGLTNVQVELFPGIESRVRLWGPAPVEQRASRQLRLGDFERSDDDDPASRLRYHLRMARDASEELIESARSGRRKRPK